ncbi:MAG: cysteine desulfurase family protein [Actinomycetota bacterium]
MNREIYMDNSASTLIREEALESMVDAYRRCFGNSSSVHFFGQAAKRALEDAREEFASLIGAEAEEVVFTSGGTESDNLAIRGAAMAYRGRGNHIITCTTEHHAVLHTCRDLEREGFEVTYLPVDGEGIVHLDGLREAIREDTILISIMMANNETGALQPVSEIGRIAGERDIIFHSDAVQAAGKMRLDVRDIGAHLLSFSGHKFYGPKGVGALYIGEDTTVVPQMHGGHHEWGLRPGTMNVPGIVGMSTALRLATAELGETRSRLAGLRDHLAAGIMERIDGVRRNGGSGNSLPNILNLSFEGAEGEALLLGLDAKGVAVSTGSACTSGAVEPSHVLLAMGVQPRIAQCSLRFSLGRYNTMEEIDYVLDELPDIVARIREVASAGSRTRSQA